MSTRRFIDLRSMPFYNLQVVVSGRAGRYRYSQLKVRFQKITQEIKLNFETPCKARLKPYGTDKMSVAAVSATSLSREMHNMLSAGKADNCKCRYIITIPVYIS